MNETTNTTFSSTGTVDTALSSTGAMPPPPPHARGFTEILTSTPTSYSEVTTTDIFIVIFGTFILAMFIGYVYKLTFKWEKYKKNYVQALVMLAIVIAFVMLLVGSNIARAFTIAWALSLIRFRNNIKDTRDIGFIWFALAIGMAMGTQFYLLGIVGTITISALFYLLGRFDFFENKDLANDENTEDIETQILKVEVKDVGKFSEDFWRLRDDFESTIRLQATEDMENGNTLLTYKIENTGDIDILEFIDAIKDFDDCKSISTIQS